MKRRKAFLVWTTFGVLVLFTMLVGTCMGVVHQRPPFVFAKSARQDGYWTPVIDGSGIVHRFYRLDLPMDEAERLAAGELTRPKGWRRFSALGGAEAVFVQGLRALRLKRIDERSTSLVFEKPANFAEEFVGTIHEDIPDRYESWR